MISSQARIDANRANAQKSTGPRTVEGKKVSRANALTHGLCSAVIMAEDAQTVLSRSRDFFDTLRPQNHFHCWLVSEIALISIKIERAERMDRRVRDKIAIRAELCWDDDRRIDAELLGEQIGNRPAVVVEQLRKTPQGCEWLMGRWAMLAHVATQPGGWSPAQEQLAFDLMGTPGDFRSGRKPGVTIDFRGNVIDDGSDLPAFARREIDALEERRELVRGLDEINKSLAMADLYDDTDAELKRVRKYEGALHSRLRWCLRQLQQEAPIQAAPRWLKQAWLGYQEPPEEVKAPTLPEPIPVKEPAPEWASSKAMVDDIHPPFDLTEEEAPPLGEKADIPKILANRREKRLLKSEVRREAQRKAVEKLRA